MQKDFFGEGNPKRVSKGLLNVFQGAQNRGFHKRIQGDPRSVCQGSRREFFGRRGNAAVRCSLQPVWGTPRRVLGVPTAFVFFLHRFSGLNVSGFRVIAVTDP